MQPETASPAAVSAVHPPATELILPSLAGTPARMAVNVKCDGILPDASICLAENNFALEQPPNRCL